MVLNVQVRRALIIAGSLLAVSGCGKKEDKGSGQTTGAPQVYPPTALVTPSTLVNSAGTGAVNLFALASDLNVSATPNNYMGLTAPTEPTDSNAKATIMTTVKERLFSPGPTNMLELVKAADRRMAEYDRRVSEMEKVPSCLSSTPVDVSSTFSVPAASGETTFPLFGQCQETMSPGLTIMFGKKDNDWYLVDGTTKDTDGSDSCVMAMAKISGTSNLDRVVDGYMVVVYQGKTDNFTGSTALLHYKANVTAGTLEFTAGGHGIGAQQVHAKTSKDYLYVQVQTGQGTSAGTLYHACFSTANLASVDFANCSSLQGSLELVSLGSKALGSYPMGGSSNPVLGSEANNVDLRALVPNYCGKLATAFTAIPKFGG